MKSMKTDRGCGEARRTGWVLATALGAGLLCQSQAADRYVAQNGQTPAANYTSWTMAASNLQDAVFAAATNDTVWIGKGRYTAASGFVHVGPNVVYIDRPVSLISSNRVASDVIIDGEGVNRGVTWNYSVNSPYRFVLEGLIISNCYATNRGGGILVSGTYGWTGEVRNCEIVNNVADGAATNAVRGGGVYIDKNHTQAFTCFFSNCTFRGNRCVVAPASGYSTLFGGGAYLAASQPGEGVSMVDCLFEGNSGAAGGGVYINAAGVTTTSRFDRCVFRNNRAEPFVGSSSGGGGLYVRQAKAILWNCLFHGNTSEGAGGAIRPATGDARVFLYNCTVVSNTAPSGYAGGIETRNSNDYVHVVNSIIYSNRALSAAYNSDIRLTATIHMPELNLFTNSCIGKTNYLVNYGNIVTNDPGFVDLAGGDFRLSAKSPCINAGVNQSWMESAVDLNGNPRVDQGSGFVDIGCYEYVFPGGTLIMTR